MEEGFRTGGSHRLRKALFRKAMREGSLNVDEVEAAIPPGSMTAAERWLLYFSLRAFEVDLRDSEGRVLTPDDIVPEHRRERRHRRAEAALFESDEL